MSPRIRDLREQDLPFLVAIEIAAGELFRKLGMDAVADDAPPTIGQLRVFSEAGQGWVAVDADDLPVGYLIVEVVDGAAHIEQVSVHPSCARLGNGRALIEQAQAWAVEDGLTAITLTTFTEVPWNGPYYVPLGFAYVEDIGPELAAIRAEEMRRGLDRWPRACMRKLL